LRKILGIGLLLLVAQAVLIKAANAAIVPVCKKESLHTYVPTDEESNAHRKFDLPVMTYPVSSNPDQNGFWRFAVRIDKKGRVVCYSDTDYYSEHENPMNDQRRAVLAQLNTWRYDPFIEDRQPVAAVIRLAIPEWQTPKHREDLPDTPIDDVRISLRRIECLGECPAYRLNIDGHGRVIYQGEVAVDVTGTRVYQIPERDVAALIGKIRDRDIWSIEAPIDIEALRRGWDGGGCELRINMGGVIHVLNCYEPAIASIVHEVDRIAHSNMWIHFSDDALAHLKEEHFDFYSKDSAALLWYVVGSERTRDDRAMLELIKLGTSLYGSYPPEFFEHDADAPSLLDRALQNGRSSLIDSLIDAGLLKTNGVLDQRKIDAAFQAAIVGGNFKLVKKIWAISGSQRHPALTFQEDRDISANSPSLPVTLLLDPMFHKIMPWDGMEIAKWLIARGCDMHAKDDEKGSLLQIAIKSADVRFVQYLLDAGLSPTESRSNDKLPLMEARDEDVALALLKAGAKLPQEESEASYFKRKVEQKQWSRVDAWLTAHEK
jgi:hypothetical protein